ncbi:nuclear transport factor 2 family protein [Clavibacter lycopersici]|uniref:Nuclear transport factor 2 family protein n=1 Tax=Clavibacter lycopersici TaxID=2301718 RepID=A0A399TBB7_9MICO|nr:nuclear transport factor 2 family protein [Clavibacter lycopersici]RIJ52085.1 nuclear transport factor 2 family protein [Clavibacter lycopersici]RIJ61683.1 nuclear transport factor 2 family protein [Clavibacter lycopersici]
MTTRFPASIAQYLLAVEADDIPGSLDALTPDAVVVDEGVARTGAGIAEWRARSASEYAYTREFRGLEVVDPSRFVAQHRLEGDFPGGVVDLRFTFTLAADGRIRRLEIAP